MRAIIANHLLPLLERHGWHTGAGRDPQRVCGLPQRDGKGQPAAPADSIAAGAAEVTPSPTQRA